MNCNEANSSKQTAVIIKKVADCPLCLGLIAGELLLMVGGVPPKHIEMVDAPPCHPDLQNDVNLLASPQELEGIYAFCLLQLPVTSQTCSTKRTFSSDRGRVAQHAEADWHARGGRTYSEIQMDGKGTNPHQYVSTFNSVRQPSPFPAAQ
jgi:hypothetical protein